MQVEKKKLLHIESIGTSHTLQISTVYAIATQKAFFCTVFGGMQRINSQTLKYGGDSFKYQDPHKTILKI